MNASVFSQIAYYSLVLLIGFVGGNAYQGGLNSPSSMAASAETARSPPPAPDTNTHSDLPPVQHSASLSGLSALYCVPQSTEQLALALAGSLTSAKCADCGEMQYLLASIPLLARQNNPASRATIQTLSKHELPEVRLAVARWSDDAQVLPALATDVDAGVRLIAVRRLQRLDVPNALDQARVIYERDPEVLTESLGYFKNVLPPTSYQALLLSTLKQEAFPPEALEFVSQQLIAMLLDRSGIRSLIQSTSAYSTLSAPEKDQLDRRLSEQ